MLVGVVHTITNKATWAKKIKEFAKGSPPAGYSNPISYVSAKTDIAFCLWEAPSIEALQPMLDSLTEGAATNRYFAVDPNAPGTVGIPAQSIDLTTKVAART
jgi:hypothetical protein